MADTAPGSGPRYWVSGAKSGLVIKEAKKCIIPPVPGPNTVSAAEDICPNIFGAVNGCGYKYVLLGPN
jgi:hypothetical protein